MVIWNDNGNPEKYGRNGQYGYCEVTPEEVEELGGIDGLIATWKKLGITIYRIDF